MTTKQPQTLNARLREARAAIGAVVKTRKADAGRKSYTYADLGTILADVTPPLADAGLVLTQTVEPCDGLLLCHTRIHDDAGAELTSTLPLPVPAAADPQVWGSTITYARRYGVLTALGLQAEDDDAIRARSAVHAPEPAAPVDPRVAALEALGARIGVDVVRERLAVVAAGDLDNCLGVDPQVVNKLAAKLGGDPKAWRGLSDAGFAALLDTIGHENFNWEQTEKAAEGKQ